MPIGAEPFGILSIIPPLLAIVLAIVTRRVILSLFLGVWSGAIIFTGGLGIAQALDWMIGNIADSWYATLIVFNLLMGAGVGIIWKLGGSLALSNWAANRFKNERQVGLTAWILGMLVFFNDYANTAIVGSAMKDVAARMRISKEKLSYIVDSTAAPVSTFLISDWIAYQLGMIQKGYENAGIAGLESTPSTFTAFLNSIPFNMYCLFAIILVGIIVYTRRDYGEMLDAEHRSWTTGQVIREDGNPMQTIELDVGEPSQKNPMLKSFVIPIVALVAITLFGVWFTGRGPDKTILDIVGSAAWVKSLMWGAFAMVTSGMAIGLGYGILDLEETMDNFTNGLKIMMTAVTILVLAWSIGTATDQLGTADFVIGVSEGIVTPSILPVVILIASAIIAFSTGTSWGTMAIVTPIAIPMAYEFTGGFTMVYVIVGTTFSGAIFGDHCSPISDTTVLSSIFTGSDHIDHVRTQIYYAVTALADAFILLLVWGLTGISPFILIPVGIVILYGAVYFFSEWDSKRKGIPAKPTDADRERVMKEIKEAAKAE
uniref:Na+/H+ antiporter family protein n=1 Tax=uncultured organism TaxID=155900 RepID=M1PPY6_9ZZZZ|nr:Na+/H+ antiporter family protein [uncultured organism]